MQNRIFAVRNAEQVNVTINGKAAFIRALDVEDAMKIMKAVNTARETGTEEDLKYLKALISPEYKLEQNEYLERDRTGQWYLKGYNVPMPKDLLEKFLEYLENDFPVKALVNFWKLCLLNPDREARERLFKFANTYGFPITDAGYFIAYKSVLFKGEQQRDFAMTISKTYIDMRAGGKRNPEDYVVFEWGAKDCRRLEIMNEEEEREFKKTHIASRQTPLKEYEDFLKKNHLMLLAEIRKLQLTSLLEIPYAQAVKEEAIERGFVEAEPVDQWQKENNYTYHGNLSDLFSKVSSLFEEEEQSFTDFHSKTMDIKIGQPVEMDRAKCDSDHNRTCSTGLHVGSVKYTEHFYSYSEDQFIIACLVSPADVVAVPEDYNWQKMRVCRYFPYAVCERDDDGSLIEINTQYFEEDYTQYEKEVLEESLKNMDRIREENTLPQGPASVLNRLEKFTKSRLIEISK